MGSELDDDLVTLIKHSSKIGTLIEHKVLYIDRLIGKRTKSYIPYQIYKADLNIKKNMINTKNARRYNNCDIIVGCKSMLIFLYNWSGLYDVADFIQEHLLKTIDSKRKVKLVKYDIERSLTSLSNTFKEVITKIPNIIIHGDKLELAGDICPNMMLYKGTMINIPDKYKITISKISIYTDPSGYITSVYLKGKHPNANSDGWYCLGELKLMQLSVEAINTLISQIKIYKLDDCYWKPQWLKEVISYGA